MAAPKRRSWRRRLSDLLGLPKEVTLDLPRMSITGHDHLTVENHKGILEYGPERIRIGLAGGEMIIDGVDLHLAALCREEAVIHGPIRSIRFLMTA
ncbi:MAG: sporulation protein YqfC [Limnochordia bacterium]|nr:sporulation protein YqfC [Bacillota bacterium]